MGVFNGLAIGRVVHYVDHSGKHLPALVTNVLEKEAGRVNLQVMPDWAGIPDFRASVRYDEAAALATWHWPEHVE